MPITTLSTALTNAVAEPRVAGGAKKRAVRVTDTAEAPVGSANDYTVLKCAIPVEALIDKVELAFDALSTGAVASIGLASQDNPTDGNTFTIVSAGAFKTSLDVSSAVAMTDYRFVAKGIETINQNTWTLAGLSAEPTYGELFLAVKFTGAVAASGTVSARVEYRI